MWQRRDNLHGANIRATLVNYPILTQEFSYDTDGKIVSGKGFLMELLKLLEKDVNMTASLSFSIDGKFGAKTKNGSFNGMVGMLTRNETDVVVCGEYRLAADEPLIRPGYLAALLSDG